MLEMEIETLTADLEDERNLTKARQDECEKHTQDLKSAQFDLSKCQNELSVSVQELQVALDVAHEVVEQKSNALEVMQMELRESQRNQERSIQQKQETRQIQPQGKAMFSDLPMSQTLMQSSLRVCGRTR